MVFLLSMISITSLTFNLFQSENNRKLTENYRHLQCIQLNGDYQLSADYCEPRGER